MGAISRRMRRRPSRTCGVPAATPRLQSRGSIKSIFKRRSSAEHGAFSDVRSIAQCAMRLSLALLRSEESMLLREDEDPKWSLHSQVLLWPSVFNLCGASERFLLHVNILQLLL